MSKPPLVLRYAYRMRLAVSAFSIYALFLHALLQLTFLFLIMTSKRKSSRKATNPTKKAKTCSPDEPGPSTSNNSFNIEEKLKLVGRQFDFGKLQLDLSSIEKVIVGFGPAPNDDADMVSDDEEDGLTSGESFENSKIDYRQLDEHEADDDFYSNVRSVLMRDGVLHPDGVKKEKRAPANSSGYSLRNMKTQCTKASDIAKKLKYSFDDWSIRDLKLLYDGLANYGSSQAGIQMIVMRNFAHKSLTEVSTKINQLRSINIALQEERQKEENENWEQAERKVNRQSYDWTPLTARYLQMIHCTYAATKKKTVEEILEQALIRASSKAKSSNNILIHNESTKNRERSSICWNTMYEWLAKIVSGKVPQTQLNALESAIILQVMDEMRDEAVAGDEATKRRINGLFDCILIDDHRRFLPQSASYAWKLLFDPLNTTPPIKNQVYEHSTDIKALAIDDRNQLLIRMYPFERIGPPKGIDAEGDRSDEDSS